MRSLAICCLALGATAAAAQVPPPEAESPPAPAQTAERGAPCTSPEHRQFDFWLGEWSVTNVKTGRASAVNRITSMQGGCALFEDYKNGPYAGSSLNYWDPRTGHWYQSWIDNQGQSLRIKGGFDGRSMVLRSEPNPEGPTHRVTWTPRSDGSVRQHWESSTDGGATWATVFDGIYRRR